MKRLVAFSIILSIALGITAFQCSSTELTSARLYIQQKNFERAKEVLQKETTNNPKSDEGFWLLGYIYGEENNIPKMLENFEKSLSVNNKFESNISDAKTYHWAQNFNRGVMLFNKASKEENEDSAQVVFQVAISTFKNAIMCQPDSADTYKNLAFAYLNTGADDEAIFPLEKLIELTGSADAYIRLGEIYSNKGVNLMNKFSESGNNADSILAMDNYVKAINILEEGKTKYPEDSDILLLLSNAYIISDKIDEAMGAFKTGVEKDPENKYYRYNYGVLLLGADNFNEAADQFYVAIEIDPGYENALYNLGVTYVKWGTKMREDAELIEDVSDAYREKFEAAIPHLEKYLELNPEEATVWELLGKVYANLGQQEKSLEAFNKADQYR